MGSMRPPEIPTCPVLRKEETAPCRDGLAPELPGLECKSWLGGSGGGQGPASGAGKQGYAGPSTHPGGGTSQSAGGSERQVSSRAELAVTEPLFPGGGNGSLEGMMQFLRQLFQKPSPRVM